MTETSKTARSDNCGQNRSDFGPTLDFGPTPGRTSVRLRSGHRSDFGLGSGLRSDIGPTSVRLRSDFGPTSDRISEILTKSRKPPKVEDCKRARWGDFFLDLTLAKTSMTARDFGRKTMQHYYCSLYRGTEPLLKPPKQPEVTITAKILKKPSEKTRYFFICLSFPMFWRTRFCLTFPVSAHG